MEAFKNTWAEAFSCQQHVYYQVWLNPSANAFEDLKPWNKMLRCKNDRLKLYFDLPKPEWGINAMNRQRVQCKEEKKLKIIYHVSFNIDETDNLDSYISWARKKEPLLAQKILFANKEKL